MNKNFYNILDSAAGLHIPDDLDLFPHVKAQLDQRRTFMQMLRARPALAILLAFLALLLLTGVAYAIGRSLGYLPGVGFVERGAKIRVLAEPVSQTREGVTVTLEQVVVDSERTVILYKTEGLSLQAANSKGELGAPFPPAHSLRLPDGTILQEDPTLGYDTPEPLINDLTTEGGWPNYVARLVLPPVAAESNELTLVIPLLQNMPIGAAPENWEITFRLEPAPKDMNIAPILEIPSQVPPVMTGTPLAEVTNTVTLSNTSTVNGVTLSLESVIEVENGFVFTGKMAWAESPFPPNQGSGIPFAEILTLSDGNGQRVPIEEVQLNAAYDDAHERLWSFRTDRKSFAGPLVFSIESIKANYTSPLFEFELDLGPDPQVGQTWESNREFPTGEQVVRLFSVQLVENASEGSAGYCLVFDLENTEWGAIVQDLNPDPVDRGDCYDANGRSYGGTGRDGKSMDIFSQSVGYRDLPTGVHRFSLMAFVSYTLPGPWQVAWEPPLSSEPTVTAAPEVCLTLDQWKQAVGRNDPLPPGVGGKVLLHVNNPDPSANFPILELANLDGSNLQTVGDGGWTTLSPDGTRLTYTNQSGLNLLDLSTGQTSLLSNDGYHGILSPDNSRMMYTNTFNLFVVNADGSGLQTIDTGASQVIAPVGWLPDNQTLIYSAMGGEGFNLRSHNLQSGETKDLFVIHNKAGFAAVSPDGQWLVFADREFGAQGWTIFVSRVDGSERKRVAAPEIITSFISRWGPDGQWLVLNTLDPEDPDGDQIPVFVNPFTCQFFHVSALHGSVEGWSP